MNQLENRIKILALHILSEGDGKAALQALFSKAKNREEALAILKRTDLAEEQINEILKRAGYE